MSDKLLSLPQVLNRVSRRSTKEKDFPRPVRLPFSNNADWFKSDIEGWLVKQIPIAK
ncbi:MAG: helix-turn-helix transcriptional regulator [Endozoicomonas sp.]|uniref:helix-turn-helix transcriptional regulator n=1 Tax=Endozoicomonas sp. TaxID=1892382 RepID=UPI003D9B9230